MKIISISKTVKRLLVNRPKTREDDNLLILKVWCIQNPALRTNVNFTFTQFGIEFIKKEYASTESIRRARAKLQEEFPELRGNNYKNRQDHQESVKEDLRSPEMNAGGTP